MQFSVTEQALGMELQVKYLQTKFSYLYSEYVQVFKFVVVLLVTHAVSAADQVGNGDGYGEEPNPYHYEYKVYDDKEYLDFGQKEEGDGKDNVQGYYHVQLPDGRLQRVDYHVNGYSGYIADVKYDGESHHQGAGHHGLGNGVGGGVGRGNHHSVQDNGYHGSENYRPGQDNGYHGSEENQSGHASGYRSENDQSLQNTSSSNQVSSVKKMTFFDQAKTVTEL